MIQFIRKILLSVLLVVIVSGCYQSEYYKIFYGTNFNDTLYTEIQFNSLFAERRNTLPPYYSITPIVFHKYETEDSIINFVSFKEIWWGDKKIDPSNFDLVYKQDSLYLFLEKKLPQFELKGMDGKSFSSRQLLGKPTLINCWQTNCRGCIAEMQRLDSLREEYKDSVNFISISNDRKDMIIQFLSSRSFTFTQLVDDQKYINGTLNITGFPTNLFLDKNGILRDIRNSYEIDTTRLGEMGYLDDYEKILKRISKL